MSCAEKRGFTLIELSVVLVIIGLIVGSILVGKDLVESARIRSQIKQMQEIESAILAFKVKYNCLPGDCDTATSFLPATVLGATIANGNNNGAIMATYTRDNSGAILSGQFYCLTPMPGEEVMQLFLHLIGANMLNYQMNFNANQTIGVPSAAYNNGTGVLVTCTTSSNPVTLPMFVGNINVLTIGAAIPSAANLTAGNRIGYEIGFYGQQFYGAGYGFGAFQIGGYVSPIGFPIDVLRQIDEKIDDGRPDKGRFGLWAHGTLNNVSAGCLTTSTSYATTQDGCMGVGGKILAQ